MEASIEQVSEQPSSQLFPVTVNWVHKMQFVASDDRNHSLILDTTPESGGENSGPTPSRLMLMAVAACTSMDVVSILIKSRQKLTDLTVSSRGVQNEEHPKYYKEIYLFYTVKGHGLDKSRVERAIRLSEEKYCSVGATVSGRAKIIIQYKIEESV